MRARTALMPSLTRVSTLRTDWVRKTPLTEVHLGDQP